MSRTLLITAGVAFSFAFADLSQLDLMRGLAGGLGAFAVVYGVAGWRLSHLPAPLHLLGDASYAIYLFHGVGFSLIGKLLGLARWPVPELAQLALIVGGVVCGVVIHLLFEKKLQHYAIVSLTRMRVLG